MIRLYVMPAENGVPKYLHHKGKPGLFTRRWSALRMGAAKDRVLCAVDTDTTEHALLLAQPDVEHVNNISSRRAGLLADLEAAAPGLVGRPIVLWDFDLRRTAVAQRAYNHTAFVAFVKEARAARQAAVAARAAAEAEEAQRRRDAGETLIGGGPS